MIGSFAVRGRERRATGCGVTISRRAFTGGALSLAFSSRLTAAAGAEPRRNLAAALAAIRAYGEAHRSYFGLPGMTLGLTAPDGFAAVTNFGFANAEARTPITPDTLFQVGSITKLMMGAVIHQLAGEGRLTLTDRASELVPAIPLPAGNGIRVQHLLDHVAGLPSDAPLFPAGGLWTGFAPGQQWHYSNTGYEILRTIAEHATGKPLSRLFAERIFAPLGMSRSRGAIVAEDRLRYAQGYEAADQTSFYPRGAALAPAAWVDVTSGAGGIASTAADMQRLLRSLGDAAQGRGGLGLSPGAARAFTSHAVPSDTADMRYGNGLMHVANSGRSYLHHTGGMVSFSSSFHVDVASGVGAFASATISAFAEYRPRLLTRFAVDALTEAIAGRPLPSQPPVAVPLANAASYVGRYSGPRDSFEIRAGAPLTIVSGGQSAPLEPRSGEIFQTAHPAFRPFSVLFERKTGRITSAAWGASTYLREGGGGVLPASDPALAKLAGRFVNTARGSAPSTSSSAAASCGSGPKRR